MQKRIAAALLAALLSIICLGASMPLPAESGGASSVPAGYSAHDYLKLAAFLETADAYGVKNGEKLSELYDPADPETWRVAVAFSDEEAEWTESFGAGFMDVNGVRCLRWVRFDKSGLVGELDLEGCPGLASVIVRNEPGVTALNVSLCARLVELDCSECSIVSLDVAGCGSLAMLNCAGNLLRSLQLSSIQRLRSIDASMNPFSELDLGACPAFFLDSITAVGDGFVCASSELDGSMLYASANRGSVFTGWYGETGELLSSSPSFGGYADYDAEGPIASDPVTETGASRWFARFERLEDVEVSANDADKLRAFLETADDEGVRNGEKLDPDYDPEDPASWTHVELYDDGQRLRAAEYGVKWIYSDGLAHIESMDIWDMGMVGALDLSSFEKLSYVDCSGNSLTGLELHDCNALASLDCSGNPLKSFGISNCPALSLLNCTDTALERIDLSGLEHAPASVITCEGGGSVGYYQNGRERYVFAVPNRGAALLGWFDSQGGLICSDQVYGGEPYWDEEAMAVIDDPVSAMGQQAWNAVFVDESEIPFSAYDTEKLRCFFEIRDEDGVRNGEKLNPDYSPDDPSTWSAAFDEAAGEYGRGVVWSGLGNFRYAAGVDISGLDMVGCLDVSSLLGLRTLYCDDNRLCTIKVNGCVELSVLTCADNWLDSLELFELPGLTVLVCRGNALTELDLGDCTSLEYIDCTLNPQLVCDTEGIWMVVPEPGDEAPQEQAPSAVPEELIPEGIFVN